MCARRSARRRRRATPEQKMGGNICSGTGVPWQEVDRPHAAHARLYTSPSGACIDRPQRKEPTWRGAKRLDFISTGASSAGGPFVSQPDQGPWWNRFSNKHARLDVCRRPPTTRQRFQISFNCQLGSTSPLVLGCVKLGKRAGERTTSRMLLPLHNPPCSEHPQSIHICLAHPDRRLDWLSRAPLGSCLVVVS